MFLPSSYFPEVVLQKLGEDRKRHGEVKDYATTPKISALNLVCSLTVPFCTFSICLFRLMCMILSPFNVHSKFSLGQPLIELKGVSHLFGNSMVLE